MYKIIAVFLMSLFLSGCESSEEVSTNDKDTMLKMINYLQLQNKYPRQEEFSLKSVIPYKEVSILKDSGREATYNERKNEGLKDKLKFEKRYVSPIGLLDINFVSENTREDESYILLKFSRLKESSTDRYTEYLTCIKTLNILTSNDELYGFNINSDFIVKREGELSDPNWNKAICNNYFTEDNSILFLAIKKK